MGKKRVVITGMGAITPIGNNLIEYTSALKNGLSGCENPLTLPSSRQNLLVK